jgi:hypothetical protein
MSRFEADLIVEHALANRENLATAIKVGLAFPFLKKKIFADFLNRLAAEIEKTLGNEWKASVDLESGLYLYIRKRQWPESAFIQLGSDYASGKGTYFSVGRFSDAFKNALCDGELKTILDEQIGRGNTSPGCAWWSYTSRYRDWDSEEALLAISAAERAEYWKAHLVQICHIVGSVPPPPA